MHISGQEEIIATLWIIAATIAFGHGFEVWGWLFAIKGWADMATSIWLAMKESINSMKSRDSGD